eukprot:scaffold13110_cov85-Skeletonema_dohrnii-CCMP3373.AAC.1
MADQNLATVQSTPIFTMVNTRVSIGEPVSPNDELFKNRLNHIKAVWMQNDPYFLRVLVKEGITTWSGFASLAKNPDEINSVKNRKHKHSTAEYLNGESELHEGTHHLFPILLCILVVFNNNNNTDTNFIAF